MPRCVIISCNNNGNHSFPKDLRMRQLWEKATRISNFKATDKSRICSKHFKETDFQGLSYSTGLPQVHRYLKKTAIPSVFSWSKPTSSVETAREKRYLRLTSRSELISTSSQQTPIDDSVQPIVEKKSENKLEHGECCCCLEEGEHRDVTKQYYCGEQPETYEVLFKDTFDIVLKYPEDTKLICDCCVVKLRQARHFRSMMERSQQTLSCVNLKTEYVEVDLDSLAQIETGNIKCETEEVDNVVDQEYSDTEETDLQEEKPDPSTSSCDKLATIQQKMKSITTDEQLVAYGSNCQYRQIAQCSDPPLYSSGRNEDSPKDMQFSCGYCPYTPTNKVDLTRHILESHAGPTMFSCARCPYKSKDKLNLLTHSRTHTRERFFYCNYCDHKTMYRSKLITHMYTHTGEKPFSCKHCKYKTAHKGYLATHVAKKHTNVAQYYCKHCNYTTGHKDQLAAHVDTHAGDATFFCNYCKYTTTQRAHLALHTHKHTEETQFSCKHCQYKTVFREDLVTHLLTHTGEPATYPCGYCPYTTTYKLNLTRHILDTHAGPTVFTCDHCPYKTKKKSHFVSHSRVHAEEKPILSKTL